MRELLAIVLPAVTLVLEAIGAAVIVGTAAAAIALILRRVLRHQRLSWRASRRVLGRGLVVGLEFLIAADILRTIVAPGLEELATLGIIILLRTVLSLSVEYELQNVSREPDDQDGGSDR